MQTGEKPTADARLAMPPATRVDLPLRRSSLWGAWLYIGLLVACGVTAAIAYGSAAAACLAFLAVVGMGWFALFDLETWVRQAASLVHRSPQRHAQ